MSACVSVLQGLYAYVYDTGCTHVLVCVCLCVYVFFHAYVHILYVGTYIYT